MRALTSLLLAGCIASATMPAATGAELAGVKMPDETSLASQHLVLNGLGLRTRYGFAKVYVAGLYLSKRASDGAQAIAQDGPKRLAFQLKRAVEAQTFADSLNDGIRERASAEQLDALKARLERFNASIRSVERVKEGDVVYLDHVPNAGTQLVYNGRAVGGPIEGADFFDAVLDLFVGPRPVQDSLKAGLLGEPAR